MHKAPNVIDLFSGCGGFGLGAKLAGFNVIAAIDIDSTLQSAYGLNFPKTQLINADISTMRKAEWSQIIGDREVDGIIGGPPCQGYSRMGHSDANDPRRSLLRHFFRTINIIRPKFFVMENVEGLMDSKNVYELKSALKTLDRNYKVLEPMILDASDFGAPTKRKRVVVIGFVDEGLDLLLTQSVFAPRNIKKTCVRDAIYDLCPPISKAKSDDSLDYGWSGYRINVEVSTYAKEMRKMPPSGLGCKLALDKFTAGQVSGFFNTIHSLKVKERYSSTVPGTSDPISKSKRLTWEGLCPTLRAGTGADKGSHQAVRPIHPQEGRVITVREAARLQGFPDWFIFHQAKWHSFRMIGNSVSPIMSKHIMGVLFEALKEKDTKNKKVG